MTPTNTPDRETSAVMQAFGIKTSSPSETEGGGGDTDKNNAASNSADTAVKTANPSEKDKGATQQPKVIEVVKPQAKAPEEKPANKQVQPEQKTEVDREKIISETLGMDSATIKLRLDEYSKLKEQTSKSPYKSAHGEVFDDLVSKNVAPEIALRFITSDKEKMSHKEVMAFAMQQERPGIAMDKIVDYIDQTYKLGKYAENGDEAAGLTRLEFDVQPHLQKFDELKQKLIQGSQSMQSRQSVEQETSRINAWKEPTKQIFESFTSIEIPAPNGAVLKYAVTMDDAERNELLGEFANMLKNPNLKADENGIKVAKEALMNRYVAKHINEMAVAFMNQGRSMSEEEWVSLVHNPSLSNTRGQQEFNNASGDRDQNLANMIIDAEGGNRKRK